MEGYQIGVAVPNKIYYVQSINNATKRDQLHKRNRISEIVAPCVNLIANNTASIKVESSFTVAEATHKKEVRIG